MPIRFAEKSDSKQAAPLIVQAMDDLVLKFTKSENPEKAILLFEYFFQLKNNQYSFENTLVFEEKGEVLGSITGYDGSKLNELRTPFLQHLEQEFGFFGPIEDETQKGEFYLDNLSVLPNHQGKGIGRKLIETFILFAKEKGFQKVGLLVNTENPSAKKLYERIGFKVVGTKKLLNGIYEHLIFPID